MFVSGGSKKTVLFSLFSDISPSRFVVDPWVGVEPTTAPSSRIEVFSKRRVSMVTLNHVRGVGGPATHSDVDMIVDTPRT